MQNDKWTERCPEINDINFTWGRTGFRRGRGFIVSESQFLKICVKKGENNFKCRK